MSTVSVSVAPRVPVVHGLLHATIVRVSVRNLRLLAYPMRHGEVVVYHVAPKNLSKASPVKPRQVLFVVDAVPPDHTLTLRPSAHNKVRLLHLTKPQHFHGMTPTVFESGEPDRGPTGHLELVWEYDILLRDDATGKVIDLIDPPVVVKEDP